MNIKIVILCFLEVKLVKKETYEEKVKLAVSFITFSPFKFNNKLCGQVQQRYKKKFEHKSKIQRVCIIFEQRMRKY